MRPLHEKQVILFDLDGTVIDSKPGIFNAIAYTLDRLGMKEDDLSVLNKFIGPSIGASFKDIYGFDEQGALDAVEIYREYYSTKGILECKPYTGIEQLFKALKRDGKRIGLATKKPEPFAKSIVENLEFNKYFDFVCGSGLDETHDSKAHIIARCASQLSPDNNSNVVMIGDTKYDAIGANNAGVDCIGVLYGYGCEQELRDEGIIAIAKDMHALHTLLCEN